MEIMAKYLKSKPCIHTILQIYILSLLLHIWWKVINVIYLICRKDNSVGSKTDEDDENNDDYDYNDNNK